MLPVADGGANETEGEDGGEGNGATPMAVDGDNGANDANGAEGTPLMEVPFDLRAILGLRRTEGHAWVGVHCPSGSDPQHADWNMSSWAYKGTAGAGVTDAGVSFWRPTRDAAMTGGLGGSGDVDDGFDEPLPPPPSDNGGGVGGGGEGKEGGDAPGETPGNAPGGAGAVGSPPSGPWACPGCTMENAVDSAKCFICQTDRPAWANPVQQSAEDVAASTASLLALAGQWECTACTTHNDTSKSVCSVCGTGKPGSEAKAAGEGTGGAGVVSGGGWVCKSCTMANVASASACATCGTKKDAAPSASGGTGGAAAAPPSTQHADWKCGTCTMANKGTVEKCSTCNTGERPKSPTGGAESKEGKDGDKENKANEGGGAESKGGEGGDNDPAGKAKAAVEAKKMADAAATAREDARWNNSASRVWQCLQAVNKDEGKDEGKGDEDSGAFATEVWDTTEGEISLSDGGAFFGFRVSGGFDSKNARLWGIAMMTPTAIAGTSSPTTATETAAPTGPWVCRYVVRLCEACVKYWWDLMADCNHASCW